MFGELEDAHEADDSQERQRRARLEVVGGTAAAGREHVEQRHVVRNKCRRVDQRLDSQGGLKAWPRRPRSSI